MPTFKLKNELVLADIRSLVEDIERDSVLYAEGASFRVHKLLIFAASTRFKEILRCVCKESFFFVFMQHDADTVENLVHLLYRGRTKIDGSANAFMSLANFLNIEVVADENPDKEAEFEMLNSSADVSSLSLIHQTTNKEQAESKPHQFIRKIIAEEKEEVESRGPSEPKFSEHDAELDDLPDTFGKCVQPMEMKTSTPYPGSVLEGRNSLRMKTISSCRLTFQRRCSNRFSSDMKNKKLFGQKRSCIKKPPTTRNSSVHIQSVRSSDQTNVIKALAEEIKLFASNDNFMPDTIDQLDLMIH